MIARPLTMSSFGDALYIVRNLRERDAREVLCARPDDDLNAWAEEMVHAPGNHFVYGDDRGEPIALGGWSSTSWRHCVQSWLVATDHIRSIADGLHRFGVRAHRALARDGVRRFQTLCLDGYADGVRWLERLGYLPEGRHPQSGRAGETLVTWARMELGD